MARSSVQHRFFFLFVVLCLPVLLHAQEPMSLVPDQIVEHEITGGQSHRYQIALAAGAYMHVAVAERGVNITLVLRGPDGSSLAEMNAAGATLLEELSWEAANGGVYVLEVRAGGPAKGRYELAAQFSSVAGEKERARIEAERFYLDAQRIRTAVSGTGSTQAVTKFEESLQKWRVVGERKWEARTLSAIGALLRAAGQFDKAYESFRQASIIFREVGDKGAEGEALFQVGYANEELSRYEQSLELYTQALKLFRELKNQDGEGKTLTRTGGVYYYLSQFDKAREFCGQSLAISRERKNRRDEPSALACLSAAHGGLGQYGKAIEYLEQQLAVSRETKSRSSEANALSNIGEMYVELGQYEKALAYAEQALVILRELKNKQREAFALQAIGIAHFYLREYEKAIGSLEPALALFRDVKTKFGEGAVLTSLGEVHLAMRQYEPARSYSEQALKIAREAQIITMEAHTLVNLGDVALALQQPLQAHTYYEQALRLQRQIKGKYGEGVTLSSLMTFWKVSARPSLAVFFGKQAVNAYQDVRTGLQGLAQETQQSFLKSKEDTYRQLADLLIAQGRLPEAEQIIRMLKEEEYFEYIRRDQQNSAKVEKAALTPEEAALDKRYREIADKLTEIGTERNTLLDKKSRTPEDEQRLAQLETDLAVAGQAFQKFLDSLTTEMSKNADTNARAFQLRESQGLMEDLRELGKGVVALYTLVGEDKYRVILTTADFQRGYEYPIKAEELNRKVLAFRDVLQNPKLDPLPLAQELYKMLVGPVAKDLQGAKAQMLMWSLDGVLRYLPVAALHDGKQYLVERYRTAVFTPASQSRLRVEPSRKWTALGLGVTKAHGLTIPALPGVAEEMRGIIQEAGTTTGVLPGSIKLDEAFTQAAMLAELRKRNPVVHIASHFRFQPGNETNSALLLGDGNFLSLAQIKSLPNVFSGVDLLTLSACNTATGGSGANGKEVEGFGVLAQRQGAKAVVASLWPVADRSTKYLMQEFYGLREAKAGTAKAEALRQAQLKLLRGELQFTGDVLASRDIVHEVGKTTNQPLYRPDPKAPYAHPYYWAPFILIGNWK